MNSQLLCRLGLPTRLAAVASLRSTSTSAACRVPAKQVDVKGVGFFRYERNTSRDPSKANPAQPGDTPMRFLVRRLGHAYEVYPIFFLTAFLIGILGLATYNSFEKAHQSEQTENLFQVEVWLDRSNPVAPWDWVRIRNSYWKKPTLFFDREGITHRRLEIMEQLQDEIVEAAKKRGTRK